MRTRWAAYAGVSLALAGGVVLKALHQRPNFYSAAVYLAQSSANLMILTNLVFLTACTFLLGLQKLLFGPLRPIEIEQLYEKAWFAVTETCLAMTIFRGEIGGWFLVMFFSLLAAKVWGWIGEGRVEILEQQPPQNPRLFHTRLAISLSISMLFDSWMLEYLVKEVLHQARPDMMVMFGFEFAVLTILSSSTMARYAISLVEIYIIRKQKEKRIEEIRRERRATAMQATAEAPVVHPIEGTAWGSSGAPVGTPATSGPTPAVPTAEDPIDDAEVEVEGWEEKGRWVFYLDLTTDFLKLVVYLSFFFILLVFYGLPIHIMRDVFLTCRSFFKRISDFVKYRTATRNMNERYPDATVEEIAREDTCIICREEMRPYALVDGANGTPEQAARNPVAERMRPKKLPCGHVLHFACLRSWLERQQICPTCRQPVVTNGRAPPVGAVQAAANPAVGQPAAAVPGQPAMDQANQGDAQPPEGQNRFRMLNLGPLRIGFGAGRGDLVNDLAQQINDHARPGQPGNHDHAQQYGFGFGFGRPRAPPATRTGTANIHTQLNTIEQRLQQEISELRMAANELHVVRNLEAELTRLRTLRQAAIGQPVPGPTTLLQAPPSGIVPPLSIRPAQALVANPLQPILSAGSDALPEGLTLPPGWTMMPLQRIDGIGHTAVPTMSNSASTPVNPQILSALGRPPSAHSPSMVSTTSQPPVTTGIGVGGPSLTSSLNISQTRRGDGASDVPNSTAPISLSGSPLTNGNGILPNLGSSGEPAVTSSAGPPTATPTANRNPDDPTIELPSLPTWGSSVPLAAPVASRPSAPARNGETFTNGERTADGPTTPKDTAARPPTENGIHHDEQEGSAASPSSSKGKSKAATVEDFIEDVD